MKVNKKTTAALAAVMGYIKSEEEAVCLQAAAQAAVQAPVVAAPTAPIKLWGISGRQAQMQLRTLMQMRSFKGAEFR